MLEVADRVGSIDDVRISIVTDLGDGCADFPEGDEIG